MTTRAQKAAIQAFYANEPLVPARITVAVARRFGVETVAEAWQHLHDLMMIEQAEAQQRQAERAARERARRDRWNATKRDRRVTERLYAIVRDLPDPPKRLTQEQRRARYDARRRSYIDVALNVTVGDPRSDDANFPAARRLRTFATTETMFGIPQDGVRAALEAIKEARNWVSYTVGDIVVREMPPRYVATVKLHYAYIKTVRPVKNERSRWSILGDHRTGGGFPPFRRARDSAKSARSPVSLPAKPKKPSKAQ